MSYRDSEPALRDNFPGTRSLWPMVALGVSKTRYCFLYLWIGPLLPTKIHITGGSYSRTHSLSLIARQWNKRTLQKRPELLFFRPFAINRRDFSTSLCSGIKFLFLSSYNPQIFNHDNHSTFQSVINTIHARLQTSRQSIPQYTEVPPNTEAKRIISYIPIVPSF